VVKFRLTHNQANDARVVLPQRHAEVRRRGEKKAFTAVNGRRSSK
jgi:hypothetical protein